MSAPLTLASYLPYELSLASNTVSQMIAGAYETRFAITIPQWRIIAILAETSGLTQKEVCARTAMDKVTVSRAAAALVRRGLLARAANDRDGRSSTLALTAEGAALHDAIAPFALSYERALLQDIPPAALATFRATLATLRERAGRISASGLTAPASR